MILMIDNYDSFTYNLVQYLFELGCEVEVFRNDAIDTATVRKLGPEAVVVSPGPCTPHEAGVSMELIEEVSRDLPTLGVCLGHQCIGEVFGGKVIRAPTLMHGKTSMIDHDGEGEFEDLPQPFQATRYHSLIVERASLPDCLQISAQTDDGIIMGLRHRSRPVHGVQFHPESILTPQGHDILRNFLKLYRIGPRA